MCYCHFHNIRFFPGIDHRDVVNSNFSPLYGSGNRKCHIIGSYEFKGILRIFKTFVTCTLHEIIPTKGCEQQGEDHGEYP